MVGQYNNQAIANIKTICFLTLFISTLNACGQTMSDRTIFGKLYSEQKVKSALTDKSQHNVINNKTAIIKDSLTAIKIAEPILFSIYGRDNIIKQRPYEIYLIDSFWVVLGTLSKEYSGGTFLIIIDSRDCKIVRITHGK